MTDQPKPVRTKASKPVAGVADRLFYNTLQAQIDKGALKYGTPLMTFNGRDAHADALAELADAVQYVTQMSMERDEIVKAARGMAEALRIIEWIADDETFDEFCIDCAQLKQHGHLAGCMVSTALAAWDALGLGAGEGE